MKKGLNILSTAAIIAVLMATTGCETTQQKETKAREAESAIALQLLSEALSTDNPQLLEKVLTAGIPGNRAMMCAVEKGEDEPCAVAHFKRR